MVEGRGTRVEGQKLSDPRPSTLDTRPLSMDSRANVQSLESIDSVRTALESFADHVSDALADLDGQMRRMKDWLEHDRPRYWKNQLRLAMDGVHEAQQALHRCLMFPVAGERPACSEERAALKKAQARQAYCEQKFERVRHWQKTVQHELFEYEGRMSQMVRMLEVDVPQAIGVLTRITRHLEDYLALRAQIPQSAYDDLSVARAIWPEDAAGELPSDEPANSNDAAAGRSEEATGGNGVGVSPGRVLEE